MQTLLGARLSEAHRQQQMRAGVTAATRAARLYDGIDRRNRRAYGDFVDRALAGTGRERTRSRAAAAGYFRRLSLAERNEYRPVGRAEEDSTFDERFRYSMFYLGRARYEDRIRRSVPLSEAERMTRSDVLGAVVRHTLDGGRDEMIHSVRESGLAVGYVRITAMDTKVCWFCAMLASRIDYKEKSFEKSDARFKQGGNSFANAKVHDRCVVGSTVVSGPAVEIGSRRWYEGPLVIIRTARGKELTITPNHPVLTDQGWVPAGLVREGDQVIGSLGSQGALGGVPDVSQQAAPIEDVLGALLVVGTSLQVPGSAEQFHGDGSQAEVDVVAPYGLFCDGGLPALHQPGIQLPFRITGAPSPSVALSSVCAQHHLSLGGDSAGGGSMGFSRPLGDIFSAGSVHAELLGGASPPGFDSLFDEALAYAAPGNLVGTGQGLLGFPGQVALGDLRARQGDPGSVRFDPPALEFLTEGRAAYAGLGRDLQGRLAGQVERDRVVETRLSDTRGTHVFNLQTAEGWYDADGIIVSNCRCMIMPLFDEDVPERVQTYVDYWADLSGGDDDAATNFRRNWQAMVSSSQV